MKKLFFLLVLLICGQVNAAPFSGQSIFNGGSNLDSGSSTVAAPTGTYLLPAWRKALANVLSGAGNATAYWLGDSTWIGYNDGATNNLLTSPPAIFVNMLNNAGINAHFNNRIGGNVASDSRFSQGSWTSNNNLIIGGNNNFFATATTTTPASWAYTTPVDTCNVYYYSTGTSTQFSMNIDGGSATTVTTGATAGIFTSANKTATLGIHTLNVNWVAGTVGLIGSNCYDSTKKWVDVYAGGAGGATSAYFANNTTFGVGTVTPLTSTKYLAQNITFINLGINDWCTSVSVATYTANMQVIITNAASVGDVVLVSPFPSNPAAGGCTSGATNATQLTYVAALQSLATINNIPFIDTFNRMTSYAVSNAYYNADGVHPLVIGIVDQVRQIFGNVFGNDWTGYSGVPTYNGLVSLGNVAIGTSIASPGQFTLQNAAAQAGQTTCWTTGGAIGYCTSIVGAGGNCTCTGL